MPKFIIDDNDDGYTPTPPQDLTPADMYFESDEFGKELELLGDQLDLNIED